jgi:hypothetical protein
VRVPAQAQRFEQRGVLEVERPGGLSRITCIRPCAGGLVSPRIPFVKVKIAERAPLGFWSSLAKGRLLCTGTKVPRSSVADSAPDPPKVK